MKSEWQRTIVEKSVGFGCELPHPLRCCPPILEGQLKAGYLDHIGVKTAPPHITPARGPPLWDGADAQAGKGVEPAPDWGQECQAEPDFEVDQRISW